MIKNIRPLIVLVLIVLSVSSCGSDRTREEKVAAMISSINSPFLIVNTNPGELIEKSGAISGALPFTQEMLVGFFIDESVTGVDYDVPVQIIVAKGELFTPNFYGIFTIKNEVSFMNLLETEANAEIQEKDGFKYVIKASDNYAIVWNEEFAIAGNIPLDMMTMMSGGTSKAGPATVDRLISLINQAEEGEVDEGFKSFLTHDSDVSFSFIGKGFYSYLEDMSMGESEDLEVNRAKIEGINAEFFLDFNVGSFDFKLITDLSDALKDELALLKDGPVKAEYLNWGNSENPMFTMGWNIDLANLVDYSKNNSQIYDPTELENELDKMGLTLDDAKNVLNGEIVAIIDHLEMQEIVYDFGYGEPYTNIEPKPVFALILGVKDKSLLAQIMGDSTLLTGEIVKNGDAFIVLKNDVLFSSNDSLWAARAQTGTTAKVNDKGEVFKSTPFGLFIDLAGLKGVTELRDFTQVVQVLSSVKGYGNFEELTISFILNDQEKNALRVITEMISNSVEGNVEIDKALQAEIEEAASAYDETAEN